LADGIFSSVTFRDCIRRLQLFFFKSILLGLVVGLSACATQAPKSALTASHAFGPDWLAFHFPGKTPTDYTPEHKGGRSAMRADAVSSASMLRRTVRIVPQDLGSVKFSWQVPTLIETADLSSRDKSDSPVRLVLAFEGDRSRFSAKDSMLSELSHALTGAPMPYATLMYVWSNTLPAGTVVKSGRTDRIRKLVVESGSKNLNAWMDYERDVAADFELAFGERPGALVGIGLMTDSDNTRTTAQAWYGRVTLAKAASPY
jgi:hypothetical protein